MGKYYKYKNLEENRFQEFDKSDILSGPLHIAIDITNKCNARCTNIRLFLLSLFLGRIKR